MTLGGQSIQFVDTPAYIGAGVEVSKRGPLRRKAQHWALAAAVLAMIAGSTAVSATATAADATRAGPERLEAVKRALEQAREDGAALRQRVADQTRRLSRLKRRLVDIAAAARRLDGEIAARDAALETLRAREARAAETLAERREALRRLLGALQRLARRPVRAGMMVGAANPLPVLRGAMALRHAAPRLDHDARALAAELRALSRLRLTIAREQVQRDRTLGSLTAERRTLAGLIQERTRLERRWRKASATTQAKVARLASEAMGIEQLLAKLAQAQKGLDLRPEDRLATPERAKTLVVARRAAAPPPRLPVAGKVTRNFGGKVRGTTVRTRPAAEVVAPKPGRVVFAGPFRGYGQLLIIRYAGGYHMLLAGLDRLHADLGDEVLAGEPVGAMGSESGGASDLYIELRHSGRPINPLPWLAASSDKVSG